MMDEIDTNHSGTVERKEFMRIMHNAPWFWRQDVLVGHYAP
jgi:hypothetical protein